MIPITDEEKSLLSRMYKDFVTTDPIKNRAARVIKGYLLTNRVQESIDMAIEEQNRQDEPDEDANSNDSDNNEEGEMQRPAYKHLARNRGVIGFCYECHRRFYGCSVHRQGFRKYRRGFPIVKNNM